MTQGLYTQLAHRFPTRDDILRVLTRSYEIVAVVIRGYKVPLGQGVHNFRSCCILIDNQWNRLRTCSLHKHGEPVLLDELRVSVRAHSRDVTPVAWGEPLRRNHCLANLVKSEELRPPRLAFELSVRSNKLQLPNWAVHLPRMRARSAKYPFSATMATIS